MSFPITQPISKPNIKNKMFPSVVDYLPNIEGLSVWLDASQEDYNDGDNVNVWHDLTEKGNDGLQDDSASQPEFKIDTLNGLPAIRFDGTDDFLVAPRLGYSELSVFVVISDFDETIRQTVIGEYKINDNNRKWRIGINTSDDSIHIYTVSETGEYIENKRHNNLIKPVIRTLLIKPFKQESYVNSSDKLTGTRDVFVESNAHLLIGSGEGFGEYLLGDLHEVIIYNKYLTEANRRKIESYLSNKWGVVLE